MAAEPSDHLFRARTLAELIEWDSVGAEFGGLYHETLGRPGRETRLAVGVT